MVRIGHSGEPDGAEVLNGWFTVLGTVDFLNVLGAWQVHLKLCDRGQIVFWVKEASKLSMLIQMFMRYVGSCDKICSLQNTGKVVQCFCIIPKIS